MDSRIGRYNSSATNRAFNRSLNDSNLTSATIQMGHGVGTGFSANGTLANHSEVSASNSVIDLNVPAQMIDLNIYDPIIDLNIPYVPDNSDIHGISVENFQLYSPTQSYTNSSQSSYPFRQRHSPSRLQSPSHVRWITNTNVVETPSGSHIHIENNVISSLQMQNLWHAPTTSSQTTQFPRDTNFLRNNIDPPPLPLVIGETVAAHNRERLLSVADSVREPGHRDDPIIIEDDEEDEHDDAQQGYMVEMSYETLLALQEHIGDVETGLKKKVISELLKQRKYRSIKMNDCSDSCSVCLDTYSDGQELGTINCGHEFHYHCIRKWLKIKNSCPICKRAALTP